MKIAPAKTYNYICRFAGDKSITHRAVMFNTIAKGGAVVKNALLSADCLDTIACMRALGAEIDVIGTTVVVKSPIRPVNTQTPLYTGNSGTTTRLLTGLLVGQKINAVLSGDQSLNSRPMARVANPLKQMGADIRLTDGKAPITVVSSDLHGIDYEMPVASAQVKSAILLAALGAEGRTVVREKTVSRDHTERMLTAMGADITVQGKDICMQKSCLTAVDVDVPSDISSCAYFMALGALLGSVTCLSVGVNPTRTGILNVLRRMGAHVTVSPLPDQGNEPVADVTVNQSILSAVTVTAEEIPALVDEIPVIAVLCCFATGTSYIRGAEELRVKESDRIRATVAMIRALGGKAEELPDGMVIEGTGGLIGGVVQSMGDHRIAMSGAVALLASRRGGEIVDAECVDISFPDFYQKLEGGR